MSDIYANLGGGVHAGPNLAQLGEVSRFVAQDETAPALNVDLRRVYPAAGIQVDSSTVSPSVGGFLP
jgi:hypothetical protein